MYKDDKASVGFIVVCVLSFLMFLGLMYWAHDEDKKADRASWYHTVDDSNLSPEQKLSFKFLYDEHNK